MGTVNVSLPSDGTTADAADYNTPITTIVNEFNGNIDNNNIKSAAAIDGSKIADSSIAAAKLTTSAITLGYTPITASVVLTTPTSDTLITGLAQAVTVPSGSRNLKITAYIPNFTCSNSNATLTLSIWDGVVGSGTQLSSFIYSSGTVASDGHGATCIAIVSAPAAGSKTYRVGAKASAGNATAVASATSPAFILVEAI